MKSFFEGIQDLFVNVLFAPLDALRELELSKWFAANTINWLFMLIGAIAMVYWMLQLKGFSDRGEEKKDATAHSYIG